jgi:hypothetical protein
MPDKRARFVGHPDGIWLAVPVGDGETRRINIDHGHELPTEIDGLKVPASFRKSLLEQGDNWTEVNRATKPRRQAKKAAPAAPAAPVAPTAPVVEGSDDTTATANTKDGDQ